MEENIITGLIDALNLLAPDRPDLLAIIGSWRDTLPDEMVLEELQEWVKRESFRAGDN